MRCPHGLYFRRLTGYPASPKTIGEMIRKHRLDLNLRQIDVASLIGCDEMTVVNWEKNHTEPRITYFAAVVSFLGYNPFAAQPEASLAKAAVGLNASRLRTALAQREAPTNQCVPPGSRRPCIDRSEA